MTNVSSSRGSIGSLNSSRIQSGTASKTYGMDFTTHKRIGVSSYKDEQLTHTNQFKIMQKRLKSLTSIEV
jgi:hypothetical protein